MKVQFDGYGEEHCAWVSTKNIHLQAGSRSASVKAKAKSKAKAKPLEIALLKEGAKVAAQASDGFWYAAEVVTISSSQRRKKAPVKVSFLGYTAASDEWVSAQKLRSKALRAVAADQAQAQRPRPAGKLVPLISRLRKHAAAEIERAVVESSPKADMITISYKSLLANVETGAEVLAQILAGRPHGRPAHVAFLVQPSIAYVVVELSIWMAGGTCVPLSTHSPAPELEYYVEDSDAVLLVADVASKSKLAPVAQTLSRPLAEVLDEAGDFKFIVPDGVPRGDADTNVTMLSSALILYTSGTTGKPKGVVHTIRSLSAQYASLTKAWKWSSKDYTLHMLPLHHIHGVQNILNTALYNGACVEFTPFDAGFCLQRLCSGDITCFHAVPTVYVKFTQHLEGLSAEARAEINRGLRNDSLRYMVSGSAALPVPTMKSWAWISGHVLLERYGMTEIGMGLSNKIDNTRYPGCVGWALPQVSAKADADGAILIKGALVFKEYYKREEATTEAFTEDGWFRTGDNCQVGGTKEELQALQDAARDVEAATGRPRPDTAEKFVPRLTSIYKILGRTSVDIIKSGGYKISALEIESVLLQHSCIQECAVVGKPDETWGEKVIAVCVLKGELTLKELRDWGKERLATYKVPQELDIVAELPRNQMGKLEKKKILDKYRP